MSRVLIVDDERNVLKTLSLVLQRNDYSVFQAQNGPDALKVLDQEPCDFVVSDIRMSPMDGYTLASLIHQKYPWIGIVFMSAFGFEDQNSGTDPVSEFPKLTKPFPVSDLIRILKEEEDKKKSKETLNPGRIVFLGEAESNEGIIRQLKSMGYEVQIVQARQHADWVGQNLQADLFLVDEAILTGEDWKALNTIDQIAPKKPVMLLSDDAEVRNPRMVRELGVTVLNRKKFFEDGDWTRSFFQQHIRQQP